MRLVVFTDLDGTLLDHETYSWTAAAPALDALRRREVPVVLASSKTGAEIARLRSELGLDDAPAIVENGAGLLEPGADPGEGDEEYARLRAALDTMPGDLRAPFRGFGDMTAAEVAEATGMPGEQAELARRRCHSEPGLWDGDAAAMQSFLDALQSQGIYGRKGGRFLTLSFGRTKADAMRMLMRRFGPERTLALGDAPNDAEMLETADVGVVVRNDHAPGMPDFPVGADIRRTDLAGPAGWNAAVLGLLQELGINEG